jgi:fructokinase
MGGGVMGAPGLLPMVQDRVVDLLNGYIQAPALTEGMDKYIVRPRLGGMSGVLGGIALAQQAWESASRV